MSYKKSIKGDHNEANEQFAHNRITVEMGSSGLILVLFAIGLLVAAIVWMVLNVWLLLAVLIISLFVGASIFLFILGGSTAARYISEAVRKWRSDRLRDRMVIEAELALSWDGSKFENHSADLIRAGIAPVTVKELPSPNPRWDAVLDLRKTGKGMHAIAKELKVPYNQVRTFLNQVEGNDDET